MTWEGSRDALKVIVKGLGYRLFQVPPLSVDIEKVTRVSVILAPPARDSLRPPSGRRKTYHQRIDVILPLGRDPNGAAEDLDTAVEAIDDALDQALTFGCEASIVSPVSWDAATTVDIPPESGRYFIVQRGTLDIMVETSVTFGAG